MGCAMRVHNSLELGFLESAYADALELELKRNAIPYVRGTRSTSIPHS
jgi:GxxExxY protein